MAWKEHMLKLNAENHPRLNVDEDLLKKNHEVFSFKNDLVVNDGLDRDSGKIFGI